MGKNILVIDDEGLITKTLKRLLTKEGFNAVLTSSGQEAVQEMTKADFDLVVCDIRMPEIDGIETIQKIRKVQEQKGRKPAPEIIITGYADEQKYKDAVQLKVAEYIFKPFDTQQFLAAIKRHINA